MPLFLRKWHFCNEFISHWLHEAFNVLSMFVIIRILNGIASSALGALELS